MSSAQFNRRGYEEIQQGGFVTDTEDEAEPTNEEEDKNERYSTPMWQAPLSKRTQDDPSSSSRTLRQYTVVDSPTKRPRRRHSSAQLMLPNHRGNQLIDPTENPLLRSSHSSDPSPWDSNQEPFSNDDFDFERRIGIFRTNVPRKENAHTSESEQGYSLNPSFFSPSEHVPFNVVPREDDLETASDVQSNDNSGGETSYIFHYMILLVIIVTVCFTIYSALLNRDDEIESRRL